MKAVLVVLLFCLQSIAVAESPLTMAIGEWQPYVSATDSRSNILEKVVIEAFETEGIAVQLEYYPWQRSYELVRYGRFDGTFPWNKTEERLESFNSHSVPLLSDDSVFFHRVETDFDWATLQDLKRYRVGVVFGYKQVDIYQSEGLSFELIETEEAAFKMLAAGRIDVYQTSKTVGTAALAELFPDRQQALITFHPKAVETNRYYVLFSKNSASAKGMPAILDRGLKTLIDSGRHQQIIDGHK